jgi:hypothetical protein
MVSLQLNGDLVKPSKLTMITYKGGSQHEDKILIIPSLPASVSHQWVWGIERGL